MNKSNLSVVWSSYLKIACIKFLEQYKLDYSIRSGGFISVRDNKGNIIVESIFVEKVIPEVIKYLSPQY